MTALLVGILHDHAFKRLHAFQFLTWRTRSHIIRSIA
jgi:hypothetical protein